MLRVQPVLLASLLAAAACGSSAAPVGRAVPPAGAPPAGDPTTSALPCSAPRPLDEVCACLQAAAHEEDPNLPSTCALSETEHAPGLRTVVVTPELGVAPSYAVAAGAGGWSVIAQLDEINNPGAMGIMEEQTPITGSSRVVAGRPIAELRWESHRIDRDAESERSEDSTMIMYCALAHGGAATRCAPAIPLVVHAEDQNVDDDHAPVGEPVVEHHELRATLGDDGVLDVRVAPGAVADDWTATHVGAIKLW